MKNLVSKIADVGKGMKSLPHINDVEIFKYYFNSDGSLKENELNELDGNCTRRELIARFLFLNAILDQGPDMEGVRLLLCNTINNLYRKEIRILHTPLDFFRELGIVIDEIDDVHDIVKNIRSKLWAENNQSNANKYNVFMDNSTQTLDYAISRWGVPLAVILVLTQKSDEDDHEVLLDYLEDENDLDWKSSSEVMSWKIKGHKKLGLGKAIGDKAAHLFAKWIVYTFPISRKRNLKSWGKYSFETPFDSNAGRVLFRSGFFFHFSDEKSYKAKEFIQPGRGKSGVNYIRVTNCRGMKANLNLEIIDPNLYRELCVDHLKTHSRNPLKYEIQKLPIALLMEDNEYSTGEFDDGLMYIGTNYCFNHDNPLCSECPLNLICEANNNNRDLITNYKT